MRKILPVLTFLTFFACTKSDVIADSEEEVLKKEIVQFLKSNVGVEELSLLDIDHLNLVGLYKEKDKERKVIGANIFYKNIVNRKNEYIFIKKLGGSFEAHKVKINYTVTNLRSIDGKITVQSMNGVNTASYAFNTASTPNLSTSIGRSSTSSDPITLENVTVIGYIRRPDNSIAISVFMNGQMFGESNPNTYYTALLNANAEYIVPADDGYNSGYQVPPSNAIEFENEEEFAAYTQWLQELNPAEIALVAQFPVESVFIFRNKVVSERLATNYNTSPGSHNGKGDALRHALWNALNARDIGQELASLFATAHELTPKLPALSQRMFDLERTMDLFNNARGRQLTNDIGPISDPNIILMILQGWYDSGLLKYICDFDGIYDSGDEVLRNGDQSCP